MSKRLDVTVDLRARFTMTVDDDQPKDEIQEQAEAEFNRRMRTGDYAVDWSDYEWEVERDRAH